MGLSSDITGPKMSAMVMAGAVAHRYMAVLAYIQVATLLSLLGMALGWRGGMRNLHGFYDSPSMAKALVWGFGIGAIVAAAIDIFIFDLYVILVYEGSSTVSWATLVLLGVFGAGISALTLWRAGNRAIRAKFAAPVNGWTFGLGTGAMLAARLGNRVFELAQGFTFSAIIQVALLSLFLPLIHAVIGCGLGARAQRGEVSLAIFWATIAHAVGIMMVTYAALDVLGWIFIIPPLLLGMRRSDSKWLIESLHPEAARRLRRVRAQAIRDGRNSGVPTDTSSEESE